MNMSEIQFFYYNKKVSSAELEKISWKLTLRAMEEKKWLGSEPLQLVRHDDKKKEWYFENGFWTIENGEVITDTRVIL